jgi:thiamine pyrophosphate-dependent acetolactate synthase large subunit-like protein
MASGNIAEMLVETLESAGVRRVFGVVGDSLNGFTEALRRKETIQWIHVRHEEVAAFAAAGESQGAMGRVSRRVIRRWPTTNPSRWSPRSIPSAWC